ncbi:MAG: hypothetical protein V7641_5218 [Blastocatellia bacterium]
MRRKTIASFMLLSIISAGILLAQEVSAKNIVTSNNVSVEGAITEAATQPSNDASNPSVDYDSGAALVTFQNYTPWEVQCYVDGTFVGVVYPGRTLSSWTGNGWIRPYARAVFTDGSSLSWDLGNVYYLPGGSYAFPMYP